MLNLGFNIESVDPFGNGPSMLAPGAYVCRVTKVLNHTSDQNPFLEIVWDVAEGPSTGHYANAEDWQHSERLYISDERGQRVLRTFMDSICNSNPGVTLSAMVADEQIMVGKLFGLVLQLLHYSAGSNSKTPGADRTKLQWYSTPSVAEVRAGGIPVPEPRDIRRPVAPAATAAPAGGYASGGYVAGGYVAGPGAYQPALAPQQPAAVDEPVPF